MSDLFANIPGVKQSDADKRIMLLLIGKPFAGKTTAAATFPNPLFLDFDHKLPANVMSVPFWEDATARKFGGPRNSPNLPANTRDALLAWLQENVATGKIPADVTLIVDSLTAVDNAFHHQTEKVEPIPLGKSGKKDMNYVWREKLNYFGAILELLKRHPGHVICTVHEQYQYDDNGKRLNEIKPVISGQTGETIGRHFTAMFRQVNEATIVNGKTVAGYNWYCKPTVEYQFNNILGITTPVVTAHYDSIKQFFPAR